MPRKKKRSTIQQLVQSSDQDDLHEEDGHSWAVSYADFLMVLLSFFIIFFNDQEDKDVLEEIIDSHSQTLQEEKTAQQKRLDQQLRGIAGLGGVESAPRIKSYGLMRTEQFQGSLARLGISFVDSEAGEKITLRLPQNLFLSGKTELADERLDVLDKLIRRLIPFAPNISVVVVGHTDSSPLKSRYSLVNDNYDLSVLRAAFAVRKFLDYPEFSAKFIAAKGSASNEIDSRTLSVEIYRRDRDEE